MFFYAGLTALVIVFAVLTVFARQLFATVVWLAITSVALAALIYAVGAHEIAVIELSVGAGLVTILIVFVLNLVGEIRIEDYSRSFKLFSFGIVFFVVAALASLILPGNTISPAPVLTAQFTFSSEVWQERSLDTMLQLVLMFTGALGILSLVSGKTISGGFSLADSADAFIDSSAARIAVLNYTIADPATVEPVEAEEVAYHDTISV